MKKVYINTLIKTIDEALKENFKDCLCSQETQADVLVLSKKNVKPEDIPRLTSKKDDKRIILLVDGNDTELIKTAKQAGIKDLFYSPVKIPPLIERIKKTLNTTAAQKPKPKTEAKEPKILQKEGETEEALSELLQQIKGRMANSGEIEELRKKNRELRNRVNKYEHFISVLKEIFLSEA